MSVGRFGAFSEGVEKKFKNTGLPFSKAGIKSKYYFKPKI
jgi:hypothetical protein